MLATAPGIQEIANKWLFLSLCRAQDPRDSKLQSIWKSGLRVVKDGADSAGGADLNSLQGPRPATRPTGSQAWCPLPYREHRKGSPEGWPTHLPGRPHVTKHKVTMS